ncbi:hypothetical protein Pse7367_1881 [Thalassoporum mexicanum PCC 7367]|uniref:hypothetical protein n=1 Tax=Thalassoporum mexicanum TaxID=3457544 RepID=UPI00029FD365|nr:hypothetical protein [Pseudanabaena sp. PCC 7367]AFY70157.1 hypothetical protein Pse7367_1881 [Pseudanabaena sp. PCC 7367]
MDQDWQSKKTKIKKKRRGSGDSIFTGSNFIIQPRSHHGDHVPPPSDQESNAEGHAFVDQQTTNNNAIEPDHYEHQAKLEGSDQHHHQLHKHKKKRGRSAKYSLLSGDGDWQPDTPEQRLAKFKANSKHPELKPEGVRVRKKREKSPDYSLFEGTGKWLNPDHLNALNSPPQSVHQHSDQAAPYLNKVKVRKKHQKPDQTIIAQVGDWPDKESFKASSEAKIKLTHTKTIGLLFLSVAGSIALYGMFSLAGAKPASISGVPLPIVMRSMLDGQTRKAYFQGDGDLLYRRLKELGVETDIRDHYRQYISDEAELDRYVNQLMYENTGYVNDDFDVDRNGQLVPKGDEPEAANSTTRDGDRPPTPPGITKPKE